MEFISKKMQQMVVRHAYTVYGEVHVGQGRVEGEAKGEHHHEPSVCHQSTPGILIKLWGEGNAHNAEAVMITGSTNRPTVCT